MDPISLGLTLAGTAVSAMGQNAAYSSQAAGYMYQAQVAENNAHIAKLNASTAVLTGTETAFHKGLETRALLGSQKAQQGASGFDVNSGSAKAVRDSTYTLGRMDEMTIMKGATQKADAYMAQAYNFKADAGLYEMKADAANTAKNYAVMSTLIGGASSFADKWQSFKFSGMSGY